MLAESNEDLMQEFYLKIEKEYPQLPFSELKEILTAPWRQLKKLMESHNLPSMRFKYLGIFRVYPSKIKYSLDAIEKRRAENRIDENEYYTYKKLLTDNIHKYEEQIKKD
jgi:hypothetical protein